MDTKEKFGQMIMLGLDIDEINDEIMTIIKDYKIGGVVLYKQLYDDIPSMKKVINKLKKININNIPLFIAIDQENGRVNRFPKEIVRLLSPGKQVSTKKIEIVNRVNAITASLLAKLGINMNLAPVVDINYNNSSIGNRSYGNNKQEVIKYAIPMITALQDKKIISVVKHFPGHGLVNSDSHYFLPTIKDISKMESGLDVYKEAINNLCEVIMVGHLRVKGYGRKPSTINKKIIKDYLIDRFNYQGLILTDDLRMNILKNIYGLKNVIIDSINSGSNIFILKYKKGDIKLYNKLYKMIDNGLIDKKIIDNSYNKIIQLKNKYELSNDLIEEELEIDKINEEIEKINLAIENNL